MSVWDGAPGFRIPAPAAIPACARVGHSSRDPVLRMIGHTEHSQREKVMMSVGPNDFSCSGGELRPTAPFERAGYRLDDGPLSADVKTQGRSNFFSTLALRFAGPGIFSSKPII